MSNQFVTISVKCAECGKVKGEGNHWFLVVRFPDSNTSDRWSHWTRAGKALLYAIFTLNPQIPPSDEGEFPVCGESCLNKLTSKILSEKKPCAA